MKRNSYSPLCLWTRWKDVNGLGSNSESLTPTRVTSQLISDLLKTISPIGQENISSQIGLKIFHSLLYEGANSWVQILQSNPQFYLCHKNSRFRENALIAKEKTVISKQINIYLLARVYLSDVLRQSVNRRQATINLLFTFISKFLNKTVKIVFQKYLGLISKYLTTFNNQTQDSI